MKNVAMFFLILIFFNSKSNAQWQLMNGPYSGIVNSFAVEDSIIIASTLGWNSTFASANDGNSWKKLSEYVFQVESFVISNNNIYSTLNGVSVSIDTGQTWIPRNNGLPSGSVKKLVLNGNDLFAGTSDNGVYLSHDYGNSWTGINNGLTNHTILSLAVWDSTIVAGTDTGGIFVSRDYGSSWAAANNGLLDFTFTSVAIMGTNFFASAYLGNLYVSRDSGNSWSSCNIPTILGPLAIMANQVFIGTADSGIFQSADTGITWISVNNGFQTHNSKSTYLLETNGGNIYAATLDGLYKSANNGNSWNLIGCPDLRIFALGKMGSILFAGGIDHFGWISGGGGIFLSSDNGLNWSRRTNGMPAGPQRLDCRSFAVNGTNVFAGMFGLGVYLSTDSGNTWNAANNGITDSSVCSIVVSGSNVFVGCGDPSDRAVFLSTNNGNNWSDVTSNLPLYCGLSALAALGTNIFAATNGAGIFMSSDSGATWIPKNNGLPSNSISSIACNGNVLFAGTTYGLFMSLDSGNTWTAANNGLIISLPHKYFFAFYGSTIFLSVVQSALLPGVYLSTDNANSWTAINNGMLYPWCESLLVSGGDILAGTFASVYRRSISEVLTSVGITESQSCNDVFEIFPNPAHTTLTIRTSQQFQNVQLEIYNLIGEIIYSTTINSKQQTLSCEHFFKGIYFVKLIEGEKMRVQKLIVQ